MCVYSYHAWWRSNEIRINFLTKTESEKIKRINEGPLTFASKKKSRLATVHVMDPFLTVELFMSRPVSSVGRASDF